MMSSIKMKNNDFRLAWENNLRAWKILWKSCPKFFVSCISHSVFKALSPYVTIWLSAQIINELAGNKSPERLFQLVLIQLVSAALLALFTGMLNRWYNYETDSMKRKSDRIWMEKMMKLDYADIDRQYVYDLYSQVKQNENWSFWGFYKSADIFQKMVLATLRIFGGIALSVSLFVLPVPADSGMLILLNHPLCALLMVVFMLGIAFLAPMCTNKANKYWSNRASEARFGNRLFNFYGFLGGDRKREPDLRIYQQQENVCEKYLEQDISFSRGSAISKAARGPMGLWMATSRAISVVLTGVVYLFVCLKAWAGAFGVGSVTQYVGAISSLFLGISDLLEQFGTMQANSEFLKIAFEFLDIPNKMYQGSLTTEKRSDRQYEVEFQDVSFQYPGTEIWALRHVSMKFKVGERLAVVGMNGSGKTTFIKLLCRLYDPTEGKILLNGIDIRKYKYEDYINIFSVVFQDFKLMALTLGENVAGSKQYDREAVTLSLTNAGFADRMERMPKGLETYLYKDLEKDGVEVSGGEAQKIAIARALYKDAPFIILDEPTAALDPIAEAEIYSKFNEIVGDKTAIYISHRLSSCKFCDEIAVFHNGSVVQQGTHESLVADESGKYYELWNAQAQYYIEEETQTA